MEADECGVLKLQPNFYQNYSRQVATQKQNVGLTKVRKSEETKSKETRRG